MWSYPRRGYVIRVQINNQYIVNDPGKNKYPLAYMLNHTLMSMNNAFYKLLTKAAKVVEIDFERGSGAPMEILRMEKKDSMLLFSTFGENFNSHLENEPSDFKQSVEEVIRVVNQYKSICMGVAQIVSPKNTWGFMEILFGKEEQYTKYQFDDKNFDWTDYCVKHLRYTSSDISTHMAKSSEEASEFFRKYICGKDYGVRKRHYIIHNYYKWLSLESAQNLYLKKFEMTP